MRQVLRQWTIGVMPRTNDGATTPDQGLWATIRSRGLAVVFRIARRVWTLMAAILSGAMRGPDGS